MFLLLLLGLARLLHSLELLFRPDVLRAGQFVDVEFAVQVVDLVLENARCPIIEAQAELAAMSIQPAHAHRFVPLHLSQIAGNGQAAFDALRRLLRPPEDLRVDDDEQLARVFDLVCRLLLEKKKRMRKVLC